MKKKLVVILLVLTLICFSIFAEGSVEYAQKQKIPVKVLILPKFEIDNIEGDFPGEAQFYYEKYLKGGEEYDISGGFLDNKLYVKDSVALYITGMGKVNAALSTAAVLSDPRFDFTDAYIISTGCAGSAKDSTVMGDVVICTALIDYDLGHHADIREMKDPTSTTWFHDASYDSSAIIKLNPELMQKVYTITKDLEMNTTEKTMKFMAAAFDNADWAIRQPKVLKGTTATSDNYWKGEYDHANALLMVETYDCPDPFATTEMEDVAIGVTAKRFGMIDRLIVIRDSVDMDVFMLNTPEALWGGEEDNLASEDSIESVDIFFTARKNNFKVGSTIIDAILSGNF
ncbi:MAG: purine nucleoside permease [Sphaerochaetaceae bacterium]|nr:purine nucleoside permease [Sphaerochaetaceae bacterium]